MASAETKCLVIKKVVKIIGRGDERYVFYLALQPDYILLFLKDFRKSSLLNNKAILKSFK